MAWWGVVEGKTIEQLLQQFKIQDIPPVNSLSNYQTRIWYHIKKQDIPKLLDNSKSLELQAKQAFDLRNTYRSQARKYMKDRSLADFLEENEKNFIWEDYVAYVSKDENLIGDDLWKRIIQKSQTGRDKVDKLFLLGNGD